jgi:hypothetical protein
VTGGDPRLGDAGAVIDASVGLKWVLPEPDAAAALALRDRLRETGAPAHVPDLFWAETANVLWRLTRSAAGGLEPDEARGILGTLGQAPLITTVSGRLAGETARRPRSVNWIDRGERYSFTTRNAQTGESEVRRFDPGTLSDQVLFDPRALTLPGTAEPLEYRSFEWERTRGTWCSRRTSGRSTGTRGLGLLRVRRGGRVAGAGADDARTAELSPDGRAAGRSSGGRPVRLGHGAGEERRLTTTGSETSGTACSTGSTRRSSG